MKKSFVISLLLLVANFSFGTTNDSNEPVSMVSFEQRYSDIEATVSLRNNTNVQIRNVQFVIEYYDMNGNQLDYSEHSCDVNIAPGMAKKVEIPAYEHRRLYSYYLSDCFKEHLRFNVNYKFKSYNQFSDSKNTTPEISVDKGANIMIVTLIIAIVILGIYVGSYVLVAVIANKNDRNIVIWLLLSFIATPLLIFIILLCIGKPKRKEE